MRDELKLALQWVARARNDLLNVDNNLAAEYIPTDTVCFHCQQTVEKLLKAALVMQGVPPPRTHVLMMLADLLAESLPSIAQLDEDLSILTPYAVSARYPDDDGEMPSIEDAREARQCAVKVLNWLQIECPEVMRTDNLNTNE